MRRMEVPAVLRRREGRLRWIRRSLLLMRPRPRNFLLAFAASVVAGIVASALLLVQGRVLDTAVKGLLDELWQPLALLVGLGVVQYVAQRVGAYREIKAANDAQLIMYDAAHTAMLRIDPDGQSLPPGQLAARLNGDIDAMSRGVASLPKLAAALLTTGITMALMVRLHPYLGLIIISFVPILWAVAIRSRRRVQPATWDVQQREAGVAQAAATAITGIRVVKALGQEQREIDTVASASGDLYGSRVRLARLQALYQPILKAIPGLAQVFLILAGGWLVLRGELTLGMFLIFSLYTVQTISGIIWFADSIVRVQEAGVSARRVLDLIDLPPAVTERADARALPPVRGEIHFDDVHFSYDGEHPVLRGFTLNVAAGETVALVGVAGSGKSTVVKLLSRMHDPGRGSVRIDGHDLREATLDSVRAQVGTLFEDPMLFTGTIRDSIAYARPDASDEEIEAAARTAGAHDFIAELPDGYATVVGERGYTLSGGQRQRVALARTLLADPAVLVLDDPTAGVDAELERDIQRRLRAARRGRTTIMVGYRESTVDLADRVVVIDGGRVVEQGRHDELRRRSELYRRLIEPAAARSHAAGDRAHAGDQTPPGVPARRHAPGRSPDRWRSSVSGLATDPDMRAAAARLKPIRDVVTLPSVGADLPGPFAVRRLLRWHWIGFAVSLTMLVVETGAGVVSPYIVREAVNRGFVAGAPTGIIVTASALLLSSIVGIALNYPTTIVAAKVGQRFVHHLRLTVWTRLMRLPLAFYERRRAGRVLTLMVNDVEGFSRFASVGLVTAVVSTVTVLGSTIVMLVISPLLGAIVIATAVPFVLMLMRFNARLIEAYTKAREHVAEANARLQENLAGIRETQSLRQQDRQHADFRTVIQAYLRYRLAGERIAVAIYPVISFLSGLAASIVLGVGAYRLAEGRLTAGDLVAVTLCMPIFFHPIVDIANFVTSDLKRVGVSTKRIGEMMAEATERRYGSVRERSAGELQLSGVRFAYPGGGEALRGIDLTVPAGTTTALVGPTGAGKSTVLKLMAGFHDATDGKILIDGIDTRTMDPTLIRSWVGYLPQEPYLFAGTVGDNIAYGRPDADEDEVQRAAVAVGAHEAIMALPGGYQHPVGERGAAVSAGVRQLICLARAYLVQPSIVLMDEATAKLDLATEARVMAAIGALTAGRTTVIVAHRLQTAMAADQIAVIDDGRVVERGTHDELLAAGGHYAALWEAYMGGNLEERAEAGAH